MYAGSRYRYSSKSIDNLNFLYFEEFLFWASNDNSTAQKFTLGDTVKYVDTELITNFNHNWRNLN